MSLLNITVNNETITKREGISAKTNKPYSLYSQEVVIELNGEIRKVPINRPDEKKYYPAGNYTLDPVSLLRVGRFGLELDNYKEIELVSVPLKLVNTQTKPLFDKTA